MKLVKKRYLILGVFVLAVVALLFFASTIVRNYVVKNSVELTGRKLGIGDLHFDYFHVAVKASDVVMYEKNEVDSFIAFKELDVDFSPWKLLRSEFSFAKISVTDPLISIEQYADGFNFSDLLPKDDSTKVEEPAESKVVRYSLYDISMSNGQIRLYDKTVDNRIAITHLDFNLPLIAWDNKKSDVGAEFSIGSEGTVRVDAEIDNEQNKYTVSLDTKNVQINPVSNYMTDYMDVKSMNGLLTSNIKIEGSLEDFMNVQITGSGKLNDISIVDGHGETLLSVPEARTRLRGINLKTFAFDFSSIELDQPDLMITRGKDETNMERFFAPYFNSDTTESVQITMEQGEEISTSYAVDTLIINQGKMNFTDNTLNRPCVINLSDLNVKLENLSDKSTRMPIEFSTQINKSGKLEGSTVVNMQDFFDFSLKAKLSKLDLVSFSPYSEFYIASPFTQGWFNYDIGVEIKNGKLKNDNDIHVSELEFGKKTKDKPFMKVPIRLALYVMKDGNDNIDIHMPVSGSTSDPKFKVGKLIWNAFLNVMTKAALSPFKALSGLAGTDPEKMQYVNLDYLQDTLALAQRTDLDALTLILVKKPDLVVEMSQRTNLVLEKEKLAVQLTKNNYLKMGGGGNVLPADDDANYKKYLTTLYPAAETMSVTEASIHIIPASQLSSAFGDLLQRRNQMILDYFASKGIPAENVSVSVADLQNLPEEIRRPEFKVEVSLK